MRTITIEVPDDTEAIALTFCRQFTKRIGNKTDTETVLSGAIIDREVTRVSVPEKATDPIQFGKGEEKADARRKDKPQP